MTAIRLPHHKLSSFGGTLLLAAILSVAGGCDFTHRHGDAPSDEDEPPMLSVTVAAERLELFMEHPYLVQGQPAKFSVHLTVLADGMPIRSGTLTMVATGPSGRAVETQQQVPRSPGIYGPTLAFPEAGENELSLVLASDQASETIRVPVTVYADDAAARAAAGAAAEEESEDAITFLKEQAWKIGLVTEAAAKRRLIARLAVPGEIVPAAGAKAVVTPPAAGRVLPPPAGRFPRVGEQLRVGDVVAVIEPPLAGPQGVELLVNRAQIQLLETELAVKQLDVEIGIEQARIELDHARRVYARDESLSASGATSKKEFEDAQRAVQLAEATYEGKLRLRQPYEDARRQLQAMLKADTTDSKPGDSTAPRRTPAAAGLLLVLRAPVSGTVTAAQATEGEFVDATRSLFTVINMDHVWIEAKVSEYDLARVTQAPAADFTPAAYPERRFNILGQNGGRLIDVGSVVDAATRTVPVRYEVANPERLLRVGMFVEVAIETAHAQEAVAIPESALVDEDGRPTAYVLLDGETFQRRDLELGIHDAGFVEVKRGISEGERVVVRGAYAIRLASVSGVIPAHGHAH